jgi:hypothetical protein
VPAHAQEVNQVIEPGQQSIAGPTAGDTDGERPVHLATAAGRGGIVEEFNGWLSLLVERNGSDLHVKVGTPPKVRQSGALLPLDREPPSHDEMEAIGTAIVPHERVERFEAAGEVDSPTRSPASDASASTCSASVVRCRPCSGPCGSARRASTRWACPR